MAPSQVEAALSHISPTGSSNEIFQALQHIANHDHEGKPLAKPFIAFTPAREAVPDVADPGDANPDPTPDPTPGAPTSTNPDMTTLHSLMKDATGGPETANASGSAPEPTNVAAV